MENTKKRFDLSSVCPMGELLPETIYHYTSCEKLKSILINKSLWLSHIKDTNLPRDSYEFDAGNRFIWNKLWSIQGNANMLRKINLLTEENLINKIEQSHICIFCTSSSGEIVSQWARYGDGGKGVVIGFNSKEFIKLCKERSFYIDHCFYRDADKEGIWQACADECDVALNQIYFSDLSRPEVVERIMNRFLIPIVVSSAYYKEYCFQEEKEVRILTHPQVPVQEIDGLRKYIFDLNGELSQLIKEVIVGPLANTGIIELKDLLKKYGLLNCEVRKSQIDM